MDAARSGRQSMRALALAFRLLVGLAAVAGLAACGGGGATPGADTGSPTIDTASGDGAAGTDAGGVDAVAACTAGAACDDGDPCTRDDRCDDGGRCAGSAYTCGAALTCVTAACDGAGGCTETLAAGACRIDGACYAAGDRHPTDSCRRCDPDAAPEAWTAVADGRTCDDGDACTAGERCAAGTCAGGVAIECDDGDFCTGHESCDPAAGCVLGEPLACDDGDACNGVETCTPERGCLAGTPPVCDDGLACNGQETCDPAVGCVDGAPPACDDGDACNGVEPCDELLGCVAGTPPSCDDGDACTTDSCDAALGCQHAALSCDDGDVCTADSCDAALGCVHGALRCDDGDACTTDGCAAPDGCTHVPTSCDDQDRCTFDGCVPATGCTHTPVDCDDQDACTDDACAPGSGCVHTNVVCDDGVACTTDRCEAATGCVFEAPGCDDGDACTADVCDDAAGCSHTAIGCDDGDPCTTDGCAPASGCTHEALVCDDGKACTSDSCEPGVGCVFVAAGCDDGDPCTHDTCEDTGECGHEPFDCDDGDVCTVDACLPDGTCSHAGLACDDGDACNGAETCQPGTGCVAGAPLDCGAAGPCRTGACDPATGCVTTNEGAPCDDGNECTLGDACRAGECRGTGAVCEDGSACPIACEDTVQHWCVGGSHTTVDCARYGAGCGLSGGRYECTCAAGYGTRCVDGTTLARCEGGVTRLADCAAAGGTCGQTPFGATCVCTPGEWAAHCVDARTVASCGEDGEVHWLDCEALGSYCEEPSEQEARCHCALPWTPRCADGATWTFCGPDENVIAVDCSAFASTCGGTGASSGCACGAGFPDRCVDTARLLTCGSGNRTQVEDCLAIDGHCQDREGDPSLYPDRCVGLPCQNIPASNICDEETLVECLDGYEFRTDCTAQGQRCVFDWWTESNVCGEGGCGALGWEGTCYGEEIAWCSGNKPNMLDCGALGAICEWSGAESGYWCACDPATFQATCYGRLLRAYCTPVGWLGLDDCREVGGECVEGPSGPACGSVACGDVPAAGRCEGNVLVGCDQGRLFRDDCTEQSRWCGWDREERRYDCLTAPPTCGGVGVTGHCNGHFLERCDPPDTLVVEDCWATDRICGWSAVLSEFTCLGCGSLPLGGECDGTRIRTCVDLVVQERDCAPWGASCGDTGYGWVDCVCDPAGYAPRCDGDTLVKCQDKYGGIIAFEDCAEDDATCGPSAATGENVCLGVGCGGETYEGRCDGDVLIFCEGEIVYNIDCVEYGYECGWDEWNQWWDCVPPAGDCGDVPYGGLCEGNVYMYCATSGGYDHVVSYDCGSLGMECGATGGGTFGCVGGSGVCGDVSEEGTCDGSVVVYCLDGYVYEWDCADFGMTCAVAGGYADCVPSVQPGGGDCGATTYYGSCAGDVLSYCSSDALHVIDCGAHGLVCALDGDVGLNCVLPEEAGVCDPACRPGFFCVDGLCHPDGTQTRDWTVLVYMAADNNLATAAVEDLDEMEQIGSTAAVAVAVQVEFADEWGVPYQLLHDTFRYQVRYDPEWPAMTDIIAGGAIGNQNMGAPQTLSDFVRWGVETYPARHYTLVMWNHGGGFLGGFLDDTSWDELSLEEIREGIRGSGYFLDVLDFDACLMGMYEVLVELHDLVGYMVAAEETEPGCGDPYEPILAHLTAAPSQSPRTLAAAIVDDYIGWYSGPECPSGCRSSVAKAALDLSKGLALHERITALANALRGELRNRRTELQDVVSETQAFYYTFFRDLADFSDRVAALETLSQGARDAATAVRALIVPAGAADSVVVRNGVYNDGSWGGLDDVHGVSVFAPDLQDALWYGEYVDEYVSAMTFRQRETAWSIFIQELVGVATGAPLPYLSVQGRVQLRWYANSDETVPGTADLDLWVVEPDGSYHAAGLGTSTPNGDWSLESSVQGIPEESYTFHDTVQGGSYIFFVLYDADGAAQPQAYPRLTIGLTGWPGYPKDLTRVDGYGVKQPLTLYQPLENAVARMQADDLTQEEWERLWANEYSNVWLIPAVLLE